MQEVLAVGGAGPGAGLRQPVIHRDQIPQQRPALRVEQRLPAPGIGQPRHALHEAAQSVDPWHSLIPLGPAEP